MTPEPTGNPTLTDEMVRNRAVERLRPLVADIDGGYRVDQDMVLDALVYAAAEGKSLHSTCGSLLYVADDNTLRDHLNAAFPADSVRQLEQQVNQLLLADLPEEIFRHRLDLAFDFHDVPFYGQAGDLDGWVCRAEARDGTTRFVRIATAYVMRDGLRFNLAVAFIRPSYAQADVLSTMLVWLRRHRIRIRCLWLDRGFASVAVVQRLTALHLTAVIACPIRGRNGGTRALCRGRSSYSTRYTMTSPRDGCCTVRMAIVRCFTSRRRRPRKARWLAYIQVGCHLTPERIHRQYRRRFGIESSYHALGQLRPKTSSRNPAIRFLCLSIGLILINVWTKLRYLHCRLTLPPRGFRRRPIAREDHARFRLARFKDFISHAVEADRRFRTCIAVLPSSPCFGNHWVYVPWYRAVELMDERAPGWSHEVRQVGELAGKVFLVVRVTIQCDDGVIFREATGNESEDLDAFGDPFSNSESMALRRALAKFGLALYLYDRDRRGTIQERGYGALRVVEGAA